MLFQILFCFFPGYFTKIISDTINPTYLLFMQESTLIEQNFTIYFTIESKYTPASYAYQNMAGLYSYKQVIFVVQNNSILSSQTSYVLLYFLEIDPFLKTLNHNFEFETQKQKYYESFSAQNTNYEGFWYTLEIRNDFTQEILNLTFYQNSNKNSILYQKIMVGENLLIKDTFSFYIGDSKISKSLGFTQLQGPIKYQLISYQAKFSPQQQTPYRPSELALREKVNFSINSYYEYTIPSTTSKSYGITTWVKINQIDKIQTFVNIIQLQQNPNFQYLNQIGGKLLQISYSITLTKQFIEILFQNYSFPILLTINNNEDPFEKRIIVDVPSEIDFYQWHYLTVSYSKNTLALILNFISQNSLVQNTIEKVNQFSDLTLVLHFGGTSSNFSNTDGTFIFPYFYYLLPSGETICHSTCQTCFGPYSNQCLTCLIDSNRFLNYNSACICISGYLEINYPFCYSIFDPPIQETYIPLSSKQGYDQEYPEVVCSYGYFKYEDECYACPKLNKQYFCPECVQYPNTWVLYPKCSTDYQQYNQSINNTFTQDIIFNITNLTLILNPENIYLFNDLELTFCSHCFSLCLVIGQDKSCQNSDYYFLQQNIMVTCAFGAHLRYGNCKMCPDECNSKCILINKEFKCRNEVENKLSQNCYLNDINECMSSIDQQNHFVKYGFSACIICSIANCKLCFQYIQDNLYYNTIFNNQNTFEYGEDDLVTGCALCENGYIFNFYTGQCQIRLQILGDTCMDYYISQANIAVCTTSASFSVGVQLNNCYSYLTKCKKCIQPATNQYYCLECDFGYFVSKRQGVCQSCIDSNPLYLDCIELDNQKSTIDLYKLTPQFFSQTYQFPGLMSSTDIRVSVKECIQGYLKKSTKYCYETDSLYCLSDDQGCRTCDSTPDGTKRLTILNLKCSNCPYYCEYCKPRLISELEQLNPYLNLTQMAKTYLTYRCIQKSSLHENIFLDNKQQLSRLCTPEFPKCQFQITYDLDSFSMLQILLLNSYPYDYLYYHLRSVNIIELSFVIQKNYTVSDSLSRYISQENNLISQIPSLHTIILRFKFRNENTGLIFGQLKIQDCQEIIFNKASIIFSINTQSSLTFESKGRIKLKLENVIIKDVLLFNLSNVSKHYQISIQNPSYINFTHVLIQNISIVDSTFFNFSSVNKEFSKLEILYFHNVTFFNCSFLETSIIKLLERNQYSSIQFSQIKFIQCQFISSYFIFSENLNMIGTFLIEDLFISNSQFDDSVFILLPIYSTGRIKDLTIEKSQIKNTDFLIFSTSLNIFNISIIENILINCSFLKYTRNSFYLEFQIYEFRHFIIKNNIYSQLKLVDLQKQSQEEIKVILFDITHLNLKSQNFFKDRAYYFYNIQAEEVLIEKIFFYRSPGSKDFHIFDCSSIQIINTIVQSNLTQNNLNSMLENSSLNTVFTISSQKIKMKKFKFYNQFGLDVIFVEIVDDQNLNSVNVIEIEQLDIQNLQLIKTSFSQISTFFQSYCLISQQVYISNSIFSKVILNEQVQDTRVSSAALAVIISDLGVINLSNIVLNEIFVLNSTSPVFLIQSGQLNIVNISAFNINSFYENYKSLLSFYILDLNSSQSTQINCLGGLFNTQVQSLTVTNSLFNNIVALQGGVFYISTKKNGQIKFQSNIFKNITTNHLNSQEGKGGCIFINSENSYLHFIFQNNLIENSTSGFQAGAFYIKLSYYSSQIYISNLKLINVFSFKNSIFYLQLNELNFGTIQKIVIENLYLTNSYDEFLQYFEKFNLKVSDNSISEQNAMFFFSNFYTKISNFHFSGFTLQPIIYIMFTKYLFISKFELQNITHISNSLIFIENNQATQSSMLINLMIIRNSTIKSILIKEENAYQNALHQLMEHRNYIYNSVRKALIQFRFYKNLQNINIQQLYLFDNKCEICDIGLVNLQNFQREKKISLNNLIIFKNLCGADSCAATENQLDCEQYNTIQHSKFISNIANYSGALKSQNFNLQIRNSSFINNLAIQNGGALFYNNSKKQVKYQRAYFFLNEAQVGGAIFDLNLYQKSEKKLYYFMQNNASVYGNNLATSPTTLKLFINDLPTSSIEIESFQETISEVFYFTKNKVQQFINFPSGTSLNQYLKFEWKTLQYVKFHFNLILKPQNFLEEEMILNNNSFCTSNSNIIQTNSDNKNVEYSLQYVEYDFESRGFNLNDLVYTLDPKQTNISYVQVEITCDTVQNYFLKFKVKTLRCQIGEYFENSQCKKCDGNLGFFSVQKDSQSCKKINTEMIKGTTGAMIELQPGFWRPTLRSDVVEECSRFTTRCIGGWGVADSTCDLGAIGALCEQCDIYNIRGDGNFINTNNEKCSRCGEIFVQVILVLLQSLWIIFTVGLTVNSNHSSNKQLFVLKSLYRHYQVVYKQMMDQTSTLIKLANNNFQILSLIDTFQLQLTWKLQHFILFLGDSNYMISYQIDCSLPEVTTIEYEYSHYILIIIYPFFHFTFYIIFLSILLVRKKIIYNTTFIYSAIIYLYCLNQQNLIKWGVFLIGKRAVSEINWIQANVSSKYDTQTHYNWQIRFIYPMLGIIGVIIPLFLFLQLRSIKFFLESRHSCQKYSFLYHEYNFNSYFWEIIKMIYKFSIILIVNYYEQFVMIKGLIILLVILLYYYGCQKIQPYKLQSISSIDVKTSFILSLVIAVSLLLYTIQKEKMIYLLYQVQLINLFLVFCLVEIILSRIIKAYIQKLNLQFDSIRKKVIEKFPSIQKFNFLKPLFQLRFDQQQRIQERFKKLRKYLKIQSQFMRENSYRVSCNLKDSNQIGISVFNSASYITTKRGSNAQVLD